MGVSRLCVSAAGDGWSRRRDAQMEKTHGSSIGPDALWAHSRRAYRSLKTFFFRDRRHEVPRHLSGGLHIQQLYVSPQEEAACFLAMDALSSLS